MKVIDFIKKHYSIFIPIILIVVLILAYAIFHIQKLYNNYSKTEVEELYTHFAGQKIEDKFNVKTNRNNEIIDVKASKKMKVYTMIYNKDKNKVIFPNVMSAILVSDNYKQVKINKYAYIKYDKANTKYTLKTTDYDKEISNFFLYDGNDLYFIPTNSVLTINKEKINLGSMSYVICNNNNSLEYYDSEIDKYVIRDIKNDKISIKSNNFNINLNEDKIERPGNFILLTNPSYLNNIK